MNFVLERQTAVAVRTDFCAIVSTTTTRRRVDDASISVAQKSTNLAGVGDDGDRHLLCLEKALLRRAGPTADALHLRSG